jgi:Mor family transcriptional regulator
MADLLSRMVDRLREIHPSLSAAEAQKLENALRTEFRGEQVYLRVRPENLSLEVRRRFNGRNAVEVARALNIGRATVYRLLKTPGQE